MRKLSLFFALSFSIGISYAQIKLPIDAKSANISGFYKITGSDTIRYISQPGIGAAQLLDIPTLNSLFIQNNPGVYFPQTANIDITGEGVFNNNSTGSTTDIDANGVEVYGPSHVQQYTSARYKYNGFQINSFLGLGIGWNLNYNNVTLAGDVTGKTHFKDSLTTNQIAVNSYDVLNLQTANTLYAPITGGGYVPNSRTITINGTTLDLSANRSYVISPTSAQITSALGFTPYNSSNPSGYLSSITSSLVTGALGFTPYNSSNPSGYLSSISSSLVTGALGYTPYNSSNPSGYISTISGITGGGDLSGTFPNPTVAKFNGQLPAYYLNYNNLTNTPSLAGYEVSSNKETTVTNSTTAYTTGSAVVAYVAANSPSYTGSSGITKQPGTTNFILDTAFAGALRQSQINTLASRIAANTAAIADTLAISAGNGINISGAGVFSVDQSYAFSWSNQHKWNGVENPLYMKASIGLDFEVFNAQNENANGATAGYFGNDLGEGIVQLSLSGSSNGSQFDLYNSNGPIDLWTDGASHFFLDGGGNLTLPAYNVAGVLQNNSSGVISTLPLTNLVQTSTGRISTVALVAGTKTISITGLTSSSVAIVGFVSAGGTTTTTVKYAGVCTAGTLTITALTSANAPNTSDTSVVSFSVFN